MHTVLVSSNERQEIKDTLGDNGLETVIPYDFQVYTIRGLLAIERKLFPSDFLASLKDGRMAKECAAMREAAFRVLICEDEPNWTYTTDGHLKQGRQPVSRWTKTAIRNMMRSIRYAEGVDIEVTDSVKDTIATILELRDYFNAKSHLSLRSRPNLETSYL